MKRPRFRLYPTMRLSRLAITLAIFAFSSIACGPSNDGKSNDGKSKSSNGSQETQPSQSSDGASNDADSPAKDAKLESIDTSLDIDSLMKARLPQDQLDLGWVRLFDGQTLMGWKANSDANWRVEEGDIVADSGKEGLLCTTSRFADYELQLEFLADSSVNSGVFLRTAESPKDPTKDCFEVNIAPVDNPFPTASLVGRFKVEPADIGDIDPKVWHKFHALVDNDHIQVWFDGKPVVDYKDPTGLNCGRIGLQFREGAVRFRDVQLRPLLLHSILPAKDLSAWGKKNSPAKFELDKDGILSVQGGKGQMELLQPFGNFCLRAEVMSRSAKSNSGIFFRCIPGEEMNGYECQINNAFIEDRRRPADWGTGAIFRRQKARAVMADDETWLHAMIVADGPHFATWVEGIQVTDWTDERPANENPRIGLRLEPGSIILQAHDPNCDARYRLLQTMPLPE